MLKISKCISGGLLVAGLVMSASVAAQTDLKKWPGLGGGYWIEVDRCVLVDDVKFIKYESLKPGDARFDMYAAVVKCVDVDDLKKNVRNPVQYPISHHSIPGHSLEAYKKEARSANGYKKNDVIQMDIRIYANTEQQLKKTLSKKNKNEIYTEVTSRVHKYLGPLSQFK